MPSPSKKSKGSKGCPYKLLRVEKTSTAAQIRKAYLKLALVLHPDKVKVKSPEVDQKAAAQSFQTLKNAYDILRDPKRRDLYDRTGCTDEDSREFWSAYEHFRKTAPALTRDDITRFEKEYRGSPEEVSELLVFYRKNGGDVTNVIHWIPVSRVEDIDRFVKIFEKAINDGSIKSTPEFERSKTCISTVDEELKDVVDVCDSDVDDEEEEEEDDEGSDLDDFLAPEDEENENEDENEDGEEEDDDEEDEEDDEEVEMEEQVEDTSDDPMAALRAKILGNQAKRSHGGGWDAFEAKYASKNKKKTNSTKNKRNTGKKENAKKRKSSNTKSKRTSKKKKA